jgi:hypothetical protein
MRHVPKLGIFYLVNGRIISETADASTVGPSGSILFYPRQHYELWSQLQKEDHDIGDLDCYALPRGRISFNVKTNRFQVLADWHILENTTLIERILRDFGLESADTDFREDEQYRCSLCNYQL